MTYIVKLATVVSYTDLTLFYLRIYHLLLIFRQMKGGEKCMLKTLVLGILTLAVSFVIGTSYIYAQTTTPTSTPTPTVAQDADDTPTAAPQTGFGN